MEAVIECRHNSIPQGLTFYVVLPFRDVRVGDEGWGPWKEGAESAESMLARAAHQYNRGLW